MDNLWKRLYELRKPDPAAQEKSSSKKPSHSSTDMQYFLNGLKKNLSSDNSQLKSL